MRFNPGKNEFGDKRPFPSPLPDAAKRVLERTKVSFIIRGYELRQFIEGMSPTDQYQELVTWLELDPLLAVQKNLKKLKRQVCDKAADTADHAERLRDIASVTNGALTEWNEPAMLDWVNENVLAGLNKPLQLKQLSSDDPAFVDLVSLTQTEQERTGLETLKRLLSVIEEIKVQPPTAQDGSTGQIDLFEQSVLEFEGAAADEITIRSTTSEFVFREVWVKARDLLEDNVELDRCPVCGTEFSNSPSGSHDAVCANLCINISKLEEYQRVETAKKEAEGKLGRNSSNLSDMLKNLALLVGSEYQHSAVTAYREALQSWKIGEAAPDSKEAIANLARLHASVSADIERIEQSQGIHTYSYALTTIKRLLEIKADLERIKLIKAKMQSISASLDKQVGVFDVAIVKYIRGLVGKLEGDVRLLYQSMQGQDAHVPLIRIKLPEEGDGNQQSAQMLIDFSDNWKEAVPSGFLSDSQIHTLALAIRLSAIRRFNDGVKIITLDDVVTSYDADHRKNIAAVLSEHFDNFQIIVVTHDETFFDLLKEHLPREHWRFRQIVEIRDGTGPIFDDHKTSDEEIEQKLDAGSNAMQDIRIAEEEWLTRICNDFKTPTVFQRGHKYTNSELAISLITFLNKRRLVPPKVPGNSNPFLNSLQSNTLENFSSHFNDNVYKSASLGDAKRRWADFKYFRSLFVCECEHDRFIRPLTYPLCAKCELQFSFEDTDENSVVEQ